MKFPFDPSPKTFTEAIQPIYFILRLAGLTSRTTTTTTTTAIAFDPYLTSPRLVDSWRGFPSTIGDNRWNLRKPSLFSRSYPLFIALILVLCFALSQYSKHAMTNVAIPKTVFVSDWVTSSLSLLTCVSFLVTLTSNRVTMSNIFVKLTYIDEHLLNDATSVYARTHLHAWTQCIVFVIVIVAMTTIDYVDRSKYLGTTRAILLHATQPLCFVLDLGLLQFVNVILLLRQRYQILNGLVRDFGNSVASLSSFSDAEHNLRIPSPGNLRDNPSAVTLPVTDLFTSLRTLRKIHFSLYEIATATNSIHGFPLFLSMLCLFLSITFLSFVSINFALKRSDDFGTPDNSWHMLLSKLLWALHHACAVVAVAAACHVTQSEAGRTAILIHGSLLTEGLPVALSRELDRFAEQVAQVRLEFTANGFFKLDLGLVCAMSGAITTYLVILVQFR